MAKTKKNGAIPPIYAKRLAEVRAAMNKKRLPAYLASDPQDVHYLTGFTGEDSMVVLTPRRAVLVSDARFEEAIEQDCPWIGKQLRKGLIEAEIGKVVRKLKLPSIAVQSEHMTLSSWASLRKEAKPVRVRTSSGIVNGLRTIKDDDELSILRKAIEIAEDAFRAVCKSIRVGQTERELAALLEYEMQKRGASGPSFGTIVAEGANASLPHAHPGDRKIKDGSAILFDWGAVWRFYRSDLTRVVFVRTIPPNIREIYGIVLEAQAKAIEAIRPGERMCDVDAIARDHIKRAGFAKQFGHGLGHGLGLDVHEAPSLSWRSEAKLEAGMVVTVEPGIYLPGVGGVRIEDDVLVTDDGAEVLSHLPKDMEHAVI